MYLVLMVRINWDLSLLNFFCCFLIILGKKILFEEKYTLLRKYTKPSTKYHILATPSHKVFWGFLCRLCIERRFEQCDFSEETALFQRSVIFFSSENQKYQTKYSDVNRRASKGVYSRRYVWENAVIILK